MKNQLVYEKENIYFAITLLFSILTYIAFVFSIIGIAIITGMIIFAYFLHALSMASIRRNGVRISEHQFPEIYQKAVDIAGKMELKQMPSIYVMESAGFLNAFATRFFGKNMVVMYSEIFDLISEDKDDQLLFVLAHEFAHLKRRHVLVHFLLLPAMFVPFLGEAYMRACEYTCDRYAAFYVNNMMASQEALTMLAIGKKLAHKVNKEAYIEQLCEEKGFFAVLSEMMSTHPDLPKRLNALNHWNEPETYPLVKDKRWIAIAGITSGLVLFLLFAGGIGYGIYKFGDQTFSEEDYTVENVSPLMTAIESDEGIDEIQKLADAEKDINAADGNGATALHYAVYYDNLQAAELLLNKGANVNAKDSFSTTPLMDAVYMPSLEMAELLIKNGADPAIKDESGFTAYDYAKEEDYKDIMSLLEPYNE
ncbi:hypothetical protein D0469_11295 [Peribacillus saganii]|uniref:Peptidase M48 domain-containing protein n=1 Tax=Peribacillus saganii TaxID=2303992 RepID=A0A372LNE9_9BACI|nr:hypothetical protein D0469_11295 [Peribacillus saganii]